MDLNETVPQPSGTHPVIHPPPKPKPEPPPPPPPPPPTPEELRRAEIKRRLQEGIKKATAIRLQKLEARKIALEVERERQLKLIQKPMSPTEMIRVCMEAMVLHAQRLSKRDNLKPEDHRLLMGYAHEIAGLFKILAEYKATRGAGKVWTDLKEKIKEPDEDDEDDEDKVEQVGFTPGRPVEIPTNGSIAPPGTPPHSV